MYAKTSWKKPITNETTTNEHIIEIWPLLQNNLIIKAMPIKQMIKTNHLFGNGAEKKHPLEGNHQGRRIRANFSIGGFCILHNGFQILSNQLQKLTRVAGMELFQHGHKADQKRRPIHGIETPTRHQNISWKKPILNFNKKSNKKFKKKKPIIGTEQIFFHSFENYQQWEQA